jgi:hypothetical protein
MIGMEARFVGIAKLDRFPFAVVAAPEGAAAPEGLMPVLRRHAMPVPTS